MKVSLKILSLMLIPAIVMTMSATGAWMNADYAPVPPISLSDRMPPCHAPGAANLPGPPAPSSAPRLPASYQCCLTDHALAIVHASDCSRPPAQFTRVREQIEPSSTILLLSARELQTIVLSDPPGVTPLRI